ncbi:hypothetical protein D347_00798 [Enterococcus faecalis LA3B-2]|nr:hypothetical protein D347_00798 [Enterococcus faecalis LA3B-2]
MSFDGHLQTYVLDKTKSEVKSLPYFSTDLQELSLVTVAE